MSEKETPWDRPCILTLIAAVALSLLAIGYGARLLVRQIAVNPAIMDILPKGKEKRTDMDYLPLAKELLPECRRRLPQEAREEPTFYVDMERAAAATARAHAFELPKEDKTAEAILYVHLRRLLDVDGWVNTKTQIWEEVMFGLDCTSNWYPEDLKRFESVLAR